MKKSVLYIGAFEMPDKNAAAHRVFSIAKLFNSCDYDVVFSGITKTTNYPYVFNNYLNKPIAYPRSTKEWVRYYFNDSFYIEIIKNMHPSIVVLYNPHYGIASKLIKYCKKHSILCLCDLTEWQNNPFSLKPFNLIKWLDTNISMRIMNKKADGLIVISSFLAKFYRHNKRIIIPPLVDINDKKWTFSRNESCDSCVYFVYTGKSGNAKDRLDLIIDSFLELDDNQKYIFNIIGLTKEEFIKAYHYPASRLSNNNKIIFLGNQSHDVCILYLKTSDCTFVVRENTRKNNAGFPTKFVEAFTSGCHIIATNISDIKNYSNVNVTIINNLSKESVKKAIMGFMDKQKDTCLDRMTLSTFDYRSYGDKFASFIKSFDL